MSVGEDSGYCTECGRLLSLHGGPRRLVAAHDSAGARCLGSQQPDTVGAALQIGRERLGLPQPWERQR